MTDGIISSIRGKSQLLQITAAISPGSSGSPIFNTKGEFIGVATFLLTGGQNLNFAVPVSLVQDLLKHPKKRSTSGGSDQTDPSTTIDDHKTSTTFQTTTAHLQTFIPSDWPFFQWVLMRTQLCIIVLSQFTYPEIK